MQYFCSFECICIHSLVNRFLVLNMLNSQFHGAHTFIYLFTTWLYLVFVEFRFPIEKIKSNFHTKTTLSNERQHRRSTNNTNGFISASVINWNGDSECINIIKASAFVPRQQSTEEEYRWHVIKHSSNWKTSGICNSFNQTLKFSFYFVRADSI